MRLLLFGRQTRTGARTTDVTVRIAIESEKKNRRVSCVDRAQIKFVLNCFELVMDAHLRPYKCRCLMTKAIQFICVVRFYASHLMFGAPAERPQHHITKFCFAFEMIYDKRNTVAPFIAYSLSLALPQKWWLYI